MTAAHMSDKNAGHYFVGAAAEQAQDAHGLGAIGRLAQNLAVECDEGVGGEHNVIRPPARDCESFAKRVPARRLAQGDLAGDHLTDLGDDDYIIKAGVGQQFSPPWRARGENQLRPTRRLHGVVSLGGGGWTWIGLLEPGMATSLNPDGIAKSESGNGARLTD